MQVSEGWLPGPGNRADMAHYHLFTKQVQSLCGKWETGSCGDPIDAKYLAHADVPRCEECTKELLNLRRA